MGNIVQNINTLRQKSSPVESVKEAKELIERIEVVLNPINHGIGLAAIQIGEPKRVGVIKRKDNKPVYLINSEIVELEDEFVYAKEGCLSLPGDLRNTKRYRHVTIKNDCIDGDKLRTETLYFYYSEDAKEDGNDGIVAIAVQHELEHFNGKLILDHGDIKLQPLKKATKVGRNDPCPCGSNKKYKKCCGK